MQISRPVFHLGVLALFLVGVAGAHSDAQKPRYVAEYGVDQGRCDDPENPCRTIGYALSNAGKGGQVLVAAGAYEVSDANDVFYLVSGAVDVRGGLDASNGFRPSADSLSTLIGAPAAYRAQLGSRGFSVVADTKSINREMQVESEKLLKL